MLAQVLQLRGCLWNSFVMVASVQALLDIIESAIPELYRSFAALTPLFGTAAEAKAIELLYNSPDTKSTFPTKCWRSKPERLAVLKVTGVRWNDLGEPKRVMASLDMAGVRPRWAETALPQFT